MIRRKVKFLGMIALVIGASIVMCSADAQAGWRHHSSGGSSGGSWGSSGGSWGSHGSSGGYYHVHHVRHYSSGGSWGSHGSSGGWHARRHYHHRYYYSSGGSSGGSWGSSGGSSGGTWVPVKPTKPTPKSDGVPKAQGKGKSVYLNSTNAVLTVQVPADAKVFVNGKLTKTPGTVRQYISRNLIAGQHYSYEIRAEWTENGKATSGTKKVNLTAGQTADVTFVAAANVASGPTTKTKTEVVVRLPENAKLYLLGQETKATGNVRRFTTDRLTDGQTWKNYTLKMVFDGRTVEKTIVLKSGESYTVDFTLEGGKVASK